MSPATERVTSANVTLDNCDREQIQYSNAVQPHAVLIVADRESLRILQASANADELQAGAATDLIGTNLERLFDSADWPKLQEAAATLTGSSAPQHLFTATIGGQTRDIFAHALNNALILEFERQGIDTPAQLYDRLRGGIAKLTASTSVVEFLNQAVYLIAGCTGFERVMAYRFQADGSGEVVAEAVEPGLDRYLGLHYPAADIPKPARRLFSLTWVRHLPDVNYTPIPVLPAVNPLTEDTVDLSYALSRSVSVMYTEYLRNMGVHATLVLTLFKGGKLWGLISCMHHSGPRHLNIEVRSICELLARTISLLMSAKEDAEFAAYREGLSHTQQRLLVQLTTTKSIPDALTDPETNLLTGVDAGGAAVILDNDIHLLGSTPSPGTVRNLVRQLIPLVHDTWSTDFLAQEMEIDDETTALASGLLVTRIGHQESDFVLWFRPEYRRTVPWAGDPSKLVVKRSGREARLRPDGSFDVWRSEVRGRAKPWLDCEIEFATKLGRAILDVVVERTREVAKLNRDLRRSNRELEEFVYTASHDLKSPLRSIATYAQLVLRGGRGLEPQEREHIEYIVRLAKRMDGVIEGLLRYSELGHASLVRDRVDINEVCAQAAESLRAEIERRDAELVVPRPIPSLLCDQRWAGQIFYNLIGNALKYNDKPKPVIEIGYQGEEQSTKPVVLYVRDNGIGIAKEHMNSIFRLFHRLHAGDKFGGGTGLGLSIVARAVDRHDGRLWVESDPGKGSTFFFTLNPARSGGR